MTEHAGDLLSALLDGQLAEGEASSVRDHVSSCDACARELDDVREARRLVRELPAVEPPAGFLESLLDPVVVPIAPRRRIRVLPAIGAAAAVAAVVGAFVLVQDDGAEQLGPDVEVAVEKHDETVAALEDGPVRGSTATTGPQQPLSDIRAPLDAPEELAGYELDKAYVVDDGVHLMYLLDGSRVSVFEREGEIDWDALPDGGRQIEIGDHRAWRWTDRPNGALVVIDGDRRVVTVVGDDIDDVLAVARALEG
jgi:hypothetical protein